MHLLLWLSDSATCAQLFHLPPGSVTDCACISDSKSCCYMFVCLFFFFVAVSEHTLTSQAFYVLLRAWVAMSASARMFLQSLARCCLCSYLKLQAFPCYISPCSRIKACKSCPSSVTKPLRSAFIHVLGICAQELVLQSLLLLVSTGIFPQQGRVTLSCPCCPMWSYPAGLVTPLGLGVRFSSGGNLPFLAL